MIIDSHCHLNFEPMFASLDDYINRANENNINLMLTISVDDKNFDIIKKIVNKYKSVFGTYGIHPHEAKLHEHINSKIILNRINSNKKIIGIGETGLDFFYEHSDKNKQIDLFLQHIEAANKSHLPLIIHTRSAEEETYNILKKATQKNDLKILIHCFTGSKAFAHKLLDLGSYISVSGIVTFKKSIDLAGTIKNIPNDRLLIETDSPYLAPEPLRGKSNEPSFIIHTLNFLSQLKKIDKNELSNITTNNFFKLFGKVI
jgi:TatD DNase family protein|tara:strand:+ start:677 stop:1453 length:777 start_codon:yes stop_codon:yes gene_type:complete